MNLQIGCSINLGMGGTKLECSAVNVLLSVEKQQEEVSDYWVCTRQQQKGLTETFSLHNFQDFSVHKEEEKEKEKEEKEEEEGVVMENTPLNTIATSSSSNTIEESIRKTMQRHEDIFQQQVRELHRLYSIQKTMMKEEAKKQQQQHQTRLLCWNQYTTTTTTSNWPPPPPPPEEDVGNTVRNISSRDSIEEDEVELTLSIGGGQSMGGDPNNKMKPKRPRTSDHKSFNSSLSIESDRVGLDVPDSTGSATETSDKAKKRPFWLF